jgi:hypothetical protein
MGLHEVQENVVLWRDHYEIRICVYIVHDVPKRFHARGAEESFASDHARRQRLKAQRPT